MSSRASELSDLEDCWSDTEFRPATTCCSTIRTTSDLTAVASQSYDVVSDVSLQSCNSSETVKQWTMRYPLTTSTCSSVCPSRRRQRRKRKRRRRSCDDVSDDDGSGDTSDIVMMYTDCNGNLCCQRPVCCPRKPCTSVSHFS